MTWPVGKPEYGNYHWLRREIAAAYPEFPADAVLLNEVQRGIVDSVIDAGVMKFYFPPPMEMTIPDASEAQKERLRRAPHQWSFLQDIASIKLAVGTSEYDLPADFANF